MFPTLYRLTFVSPSFTSYEAGTSPDWDGDTKVCLFKYCQKSNEKADSAAKSALDLPRTKVGVPYNDFKHCINQYIFNTWQDDWNGAVMNKLHSVKPVLGDWQSSYRKDEVVLCRARIGHTHLTHSYILRKDPPPLCERCQCILTVRHILVECNHFAQERKDIFGRRDVVESFRFHPTLIVLFLKQIELYYTF